MMSTYSEYPLSAPPDTESARLQPCTTRGAAWDRLRIRVWLAPRHPDSSGAWQARAAEPLRPSPAATRYPFGAGNQLAKLADWVISKAGLATRLDREPEYATLRNGPMARTD